MRSSPIQFFVDIDRLVDKAKWQLVPMLLGTNDDTQPTRRTVTSEIKISRRPTGSGTALAEPGESGIVRSEQAGVAWDIVKRSETINRSWRSHHTITTLFMY